jgi:hypothetical protein
MTFEAKTEHVYIVEEIGNRFQLREPRPGRVILDNVTWDEIDSYIKNAVDNSDTVHFIHK